jgi:hypothetical protein
MPRQALALARVAILLVLKRNIRFSRLRWSYKLFRIAASEKLSVSFAFLKRRALA